MTQEKTHANSTELEKMLIESQKARDSSRQLIDVSLNTMNSLTALASLCSEAADGSGSTSIDGEGMAHLLNLLCDDLSCSTPSD